MPTSSGQQARFQHIRLCKTVWHLVRPSGQDQEASAILRSLSVAFLCLRRGVPLQKGDPVCGACRCLFSRAVWDLVFFFGLSLSFCFRSLAPARPAPPRKRRARLRRRTATSVDAGAVHLQWRKKTRCVHVACGSKAMLRTSSKLLSRNKTDPPPPPHPHTQARRPEGLIEGSESEFGGVIPPRPCSNGGLKQQALLCFGS